MAQIFANAARAVLAAGIASGDTTVTIVSGGSLFPVVANPDFARAVLQDANGIEIVLITAHTANATSFTVTRAQEGTTARSFDAGSVFGIRVTAADMDVAVSVTPAGSQTLTNKTFGDNPTFSAGTANGVAYLNGSKVLTTGSALTFDGASLGLSTNGSSYGWTNSGNNVAVNAASGVLDFYTGTSAYNKRYTLAADGTAIWTIGSEQMRLTSTGLGIGTSTPGVKLDVQGSAPSNVVAASVTNTADSGFSILRLRNTGASGRDYQIGVGGNTSGQNGNLYVFDATAGAVRATLDSSGNLGLGVTPSAWTNSRRAFQIGGDTVAALGFAGAISETLTNAYVNSGVFKYYANGPAGNFDFNSASSGGFAWRIAGSGTAGNAISFTQAMTLDASGNLGVGTTTPVGALQVLRASANPTVNVTRTTSSATTIGDALYLRLNDTNGTNGMRTEIGMGYGIPGTQTYTPALIGYVQTTGTANTLGDIYFATRSVTTDTAPTERARIHASGGFSVGTTTNPGAGLIADSMGNVRAIPPSGTRTSSYTLVKADVGDYVQVGSGGSITIPDAVFAEGDVVSVFNNTSGTVTITCSITTAYIGGADADKATMTLAARGVATILFISGTVCVVNGNVV